MGTTRIHGCAVLFLLGVAGCGGTPDTGGAGGASGSASSSAASNGTGASCLTCADALAHGKIGEQTVCSPEIAAWHAMIQCACVGDCAASCSGACEGGGASVKCTSCVADAVKGCPATLAACKTP